jgi:hypothetical protein
VRSNQNRRAWWTDSTRGRRSLVTSRRGGACPLTDEAGPSITPSPSSPALYEAIKDAELLSPISASAPPRTVCGTRTTGASS